jgi:hypothetical protein
MVSGSLWEERNRSARGEVIHGNGDWLNGRKDIEVVSDEARALKQRTRNESITYCRC